MKRQCKALRPKAKNPYANKHREKVERFNSSFQSSERKKKKSRRAKREEKMGSRLGRRVVNFANIPIKLLMPTSLSNITEISLKTICSASKIEIKRVLESLYGFEVEEVRTLNMDGKKKKRGGLLLAKPDYKKAYVTLRSPLSISPDLYPIRIIHEDKRAVANQSKSRSGTVEKDDQVDPTIKSHWLDDKRDTKGKPDRRGGARRTGHGGGGRGGGGGGGASAATSGAKFPWSSMKSLYSR